MGIVNVTPDSFSDGGLFLEADAAVEHGRRLAAEGAAVVDVGGESTRPGADPVPADEERRRVEPVVERLARELDAAVSIDSTGKEYDERGEFTRAISGLFGTPINFGFRSKVLATAVAQVLTEMRTDGSLQALLDRYGVKAFDGPFEVVGPN